MLFRSIRDTVGPIDNLNRMTVSDRSKIMNILLYGNQDLHIDDNIIIFLAVQDYIIRSGRFARLSSSQSV